MEKQKNQNICRESWRNSFYALKILNFAIRKEGVIMRQRFKENVTMILLVAMSYSMQCSVALGESDDLEDQREKDDASILCRGPPERGFFCELKTLDFAIRQERSNYETGN